MQKHSTKEIVANVLAATDIVRVVGSVLELKPSGSGRFKALCPFHNEKTPSFIVNAHRQIFHCFGCGKGGDALTFLQEHDGMTFGEALRHLADRAGIQLPAYSAKDEQGAKLRTALLDFGKFAAQQYRAFLNNPDKGRIGRRYLDTRQLNATTIERFGLGYAPEGWSNLLDCAKRVNTPSQVLDQCGLFKQSERSRGKYDLFRNRLIFPIKDIAGNIVAFGGRALDDNPAKYINSPETTVYKKSRILYGLHEARDALRKEKYVLLVEGYFDLLRCFDVGIENVVAGCGTALTTEQAALIRRYVPEVVILYDGDNAGIKAALKGIGVLTKAGLTVRALALPDGKDPDDYIREAGLESFRAQIAAAQDFISFYVRMSAARAETIEGRTAIAQEIFEILHHLDDTLRIDEYLKLLARELRLNEWACRKEYTAFQKRGQERQPIRPVQQQAPAKIELKRDDIDFIAALLNEEALLAKAQATLADISLGDSPVEQVVHELLQQGSENLTQRLADETTRSLFAAAANVDCAPEHAEKVVIKRLHRLEHEALQRQDAWLQNQIREAERGNDTARMLELFTQKTQLKKKMEQVGAA